MQKASRHKRGGLSSASSVQTPVETAARFCLPVRLLASVEHRADLTSFEHRAAVARLGASSAGVLPYVSPQRRQHEASAPRDELLALNRRAGGLGSTWRVGIAKQSLVTMLRSLFSL
jgi:hypothetical protein